MSGLCVGLNNFGSSIRVQGAICSWANLASPQSVQQTTGLVARRHTGACCSQLDQAGSRCSIKHYTEPINMVQGATILQGGGAVLANRAVAWLGALSLNATAPDQAASPAVARFVADFMAPGDPAHPGDFVLTSGGLLGILKNGYALCMCMQLFMHPCQQGGYSECGPVCSILAHRLRFSSSRRRLLNLLYLFCRPFIAAFIAFFIAQLLKIFTFWYSDQRWDYTRVVGSGGMPSSHTACVSPLPPLQSSADPLVPRVMLQASSNCCWTNHHKHLHSLFLQVIALTTAIGVIRGTNSEAFALGLVFSLVVRAQHPLQHPLQA